MLRRVETFVSQRYQSFDRSFCLIKGCTGKARRYPQRAGWNVDNDTGDRLAQLFGKFHSLVVIVSRKQDAKFFPTQAREDATWWQKSSAGLGNPTKKRITDRVTVRVINRLEVIEIEHDEGQRLTKFAPAFLFPGHRLTEVPAICGASQVVAC